MIFFIGMCDYLCNKQDNLYYANLAQEIHAAEGKGEFSYLFDVYEKFANTLAVKAALAIKTIEAYLNKDISSLKSIIKEYDSFTERLKEFHRVHQLRWFKENKPNGFDVQDIRLGGLLQRALSCRERLLQLADGEIKEIPELEEAVLDERNCHNSWGGLVTPNSI